jgi:NAD-dependent dihydropyrimidine dehydrogenase PreA subunit
MHDKGHSYSPEQVKKYRKFFVYLNNNTWYKVPETEDMVKLVMYRFKPDEIEFLQDFPTMPMGLDDIALVKKMDRDELSVKLDRMSKDGLLYRFTRGDKVYYYLQDLYSVWRTYGWPGASGDNKHEIAKFQHDSFPEFISPFEHVTEKGLRVIPVEQTVDDPRVILPYEAVSKMLNSYTYFCVTYCGCRDRKNNNREMENCKYPVENCLHFDKLAHYAVENGLGREITRQEAENILHEAAELGLVHGISNQQMGTDTICNCCKCCCMWFETMYRCKHNGTLTPSNYHIAIDQETCTGCGLCVKRCPMEAITLVDIPDARGRKTMVVDDKGHARELVNKTGKVSTANTDLCIGCGVCAYKCPSKSLKLTRNEAVHHPPATGRDWMMQFITQSRQVQ